MINEQFDRIRVLILGNIGTNAFVVEKDQYVQEIGTLRTKAAKVDHLEAENCRLTIELDAIREYQQRWLGLDEGQHVSGSRERDADSPTERDVTTTVHIEDYRRVKEELESSERDYGKLVGAHNILQSKVRYYKDMTKQWREYTKRWVSKDATKRAKLVTTVTPKQTSPMLAREQGPSSAPTPPAFPPGITPSVSDSSRSTSPQQPGSVGSTILQISKYAIAEQEESMEALRTDIVATQSALDHGHRTDVGETTASSDDSDWIPRSADHFKALPSRDLDYRDGALLPPAEHDGGSSPVVVFERPVKRKRPTRNQEEHFRVHEDDILHTKGITRPQPLKNEQHTSSPLPITASLPIGGGHDSLDLDDVGDHLNTPKKRQRMERDRLRSSMLAPPASSLEDQGMLDGVQDNATDQGKGVDLSSAKREEGTALFKNTSCQSNVNETCQHDPVGMEQERRARKYAKRAQLQAHNDRVVGRIEAEHQIPSNGAVPRASESMSPSAKAYPTPATTAPNRSHTPKGRRDQEQRKAELASPILRPTDPNAQILPRTSEDAAHHKRSIPPSRRDRGAAHVPALAEDGEDAFAKNNKQAALKERTTAKQIDSDATAKKFVKAPDIHRRLGILLTEPSPAKSAIGSEDLDLTGVNPSLKTPGSRMVQMARLPAPTTPQSMLARTSDTRHQVERRSIQGTDSNVDNIINVRNDSEKATTKRLTPQSTSRIFPSLNFPPVDHPEHEPLRARPLHRLTVDDFRINPAYSDFAYREPIRTLDEKRAVGGCTDRHCHRCKDQRQFVQESGYQTLRKPGESADEADERILEDFVGGDNRRLKRMTKEERTEMLWQAKAKEFADQYGKHRQAFARPRDAPGLWDVDFPNTQEEERRREAARLIDKEDAKERYFEALKTGGKYVFADEVK